MHVPVLLEEVLSLFSPRDAERYLDLTAGYGGHASAVIKRTGLQPKHVLVDRDEYAINELQKLFADDVTLMRDAASEALKKLQNSGEKFDLILADIGVSSLHLDMANRGFSFQADGPLDMRMDQRGSQTAADIVNNSSAEELADIIWRYGEERQSRRIAKAIISARPLTSTQQLADVVLHAIGRQSGSHHPATKTFQALRIAVNDELGQLKEILEIAPRLLNPDGRLGIISFHSLEDRMVKNAFLELCAGGYEAECQLLTKKPITASLNEIAINPRSRSAKLRGLVKIKTKKG